ncbi:MAG: PKD domain-containing protein [Saprospiraceae bacterium]|nr:PKD domain-containing protein [Saprospiraceae bacterium]
MTKLTTSKKVLLIAIAFVAWVLPLRAAHIVGGTINYVCNGNGQYTFTMKIYRDCYGGGAAFDSDFTNGAPFAGTVTIFKGNSTVPFEVISLGTPTITNIPPTISNPCLLVPPNVCVEEGVYIFDLDLPVSTSSYHVVYQRCCRNSTISNIVQPGETGATYYMELTANAQAVCNNSPTFNDFPPIAICTGEPIDFNHAATDPDGDLLVYELCTPFVGGGNDQINSTAPNGVAPDPDLPPPYSAVGFSGPYSFTNPLSANPPVTIDPSTGFLTGVPNASGQFVVGVCVKEYRNGLLLSETRRDFQFNVAICDPTVVADVLENDTVTFDEVQYYVVNACGSSSVLFTNQSYQQAYINDFRWEFDINGVTQTFTDWNPTVDFPGVGTYYGLLLLNPGAVSCDDTAYIEVNVYPGITADFDFAYDTCVAGPVAFTDETSAGAGPGSIVSWQWDFGDSKVSQEQDPLHTYQIPGDFEVHLLVRDSNNCTGTRTKTLPYFPIPQLLVVAPSEFIGCQPAEIFFDNLSEPVNESYTLNWDFGDGGTSSDISPTHVYDDVGTFTVSLEIISPLGCQTDTTWNNLITVLSSPVADFSYTPSQLSNLVPTAQFTDESTNAVKWRWTFGASGISIDQNPTHTFPDTGLQVVQLVVFHPSGCTDTIQKVLDVIPEVRYFLPNAFTPNGDGSNDGFRGNGVMEGSKDFMLRVWNRYGEQLFETNDPFEAWNGRKNNTGDLSPQGVYVVVVTYTGPRGDKYELRGYATLIK